MSSGYSGPRLFSGWGVRIMAEGEACHNPIGYQMVTVGRSATPSLPGVCAPLPRWKGNLEVLDLPGRWKRIDAFDRGRIDTNRVRLR
jgi:hypothetical protein